MNGAFMDAPRNAAAPMKAKAATSEPGQAAAHGRPMTAPSPACQAMVTRSFVVLVTTLTVWCTLTSGMPVKVLVGVGAEVAEGLALGSALGVAGGVVAATSMRPP